MKQWVIADFEWCITPYHAGEQFHYFNEILSAGAVRMDETGTILERFYSLIRPISPEYVHPVILDTLHLDIAALAAAPEFHTVFKQFLIFANSTNGPIFTFGSADRSAVLQNLRIKCNGFVTNAEQYLPPMYDIQPILCRAANIVPPFPSLSTLLKKLQLSGEFRHNALSDAEDTAKILAHLLNENEKILTPLLKAKMDAANAGHLAAKAPTSIPEPGTKEQESMSSAAERPAVIPGAFRTPGEALNAARRQRVACPVCGAAISTGTWIRCTKTEMMTLCSCEAHGRYLCITTAVPAQKDAENDRTDLYSAMSEMHPYEDPYKARYEQARRMVRLHRIQRTQQSK
ncbi:MAG: exonuclease domain-containing protein [Clostridia bacterium]|nr:exonuclease domain-containing protein [Clostridia bacterium]